MSTKILENINWEGEETVQSEFRNLTWDSSNTGKASLSKSSEHGAKSPLADVEKALVEICIQMGKIRHPLNCKEAIELTNNLIKDTDSQKELVKFQTQRKLGSKDGKVSNG